MAINMAWELDQELLEEGKSLIDKTIIRLSKKDSLDFYTMRKKLTLLANKLGFKQAMKEARVFKKLIIPLMYMSAPQCFYSSLCKYQDELCKYVNTKNLPFKVYTRD